MAKNLTFERNITEKVAIKGLLSEDCSTITYTDKDKNEKDVTVKDLLNAMKNQYIEFSCQVKTKEELEVIPAEDADEIE